MKHFTTYIGCRWILIRVLLFGSFWDCKLKISKVIQKFQLLMLILIYVGSNAAAGRVPNFPEWFLETDERKWRAFSRGGQYRIAAGSRGPLFAAASHWATASYSQVFHCRVPLSHLTACWWCAFTTDTSYWFVLEFTCTVNAVLIFRVHNIRVRIHENF